MPVVSCWWAVWVIFCPSVCVILWQIKPVFLWYDNISLHWKRENPFSISAGMTPNLFRMRLLVSWHILRTLDSYSSSSVLFIQYAFALKWDFFGGRILILMRLDECLPQTLEVSVSRWVWPKSSLSIALSPQSLGIGSVTLGWLKLCAMGRRIHIEI